MNYKKEYRKYLTSAILDNANNKIASASFMVAFAVFLGLNNFWIGIYVVLDTMTNVIQVLAAPLFSKIGQSKKVVLINYALYRLSSVAFAFIPFISSDTSIRTIWFFVFAGIYAIAGELGYITFVNWRMSLLKKKDRTKFSATKNVFKNTIVVAFSLVMGIILESFTRGGYELTGFLILFTIVFIIAFVDIFIRVNTYKPTLVQESINLKDSVKMPATDKSFRKVLIFCGLYRFAISIGLLYLNVFALRYLNVDYLYYGILNVCIYLSEAVFSVFWAKIARARRWARLVVPMSVIYIIAFASLLLPGKELLLLLLPLIYILIGCGNSAYDLYDNVAIYESSKRKFQTSYVTFERFIEGIVTMLVPVLSITILNGQDEKSIKLTFLAAAVVFLVIFVYCRVVFGKNKTCPHEQVFE
jgi:Na+/melibiose symporter-like transporter